ncbi:MAG: hypothetical protein HOP13_05400 [Alphaproteobacteria bacterium]|nr:hypothetical protein [Alphaproteobacteria bacterium]
MPTLSQQGATALLTSESELNIEDISWINWAIDSNPSQRRNWENIKLWLVERKKTQTHAMLGRLGRVTRGELNISKLPAKCFDDLLCEQLNTVVEVVEKIPRDQLRDAVVQAEPYVRAYIGAADTAAGLTPVRALPDSSLLKKVHSRKFRQALIGRLMFRNVPVSKSAQGIVQAFLTAKLRKISFEDVLFLKADFLKPTWPPRSQAKEESWNAWYLVQHADHIPDFQFEMLRQMEALVQRDEMFPDLYAALYDRVRLNVGLPQRFGTQFDCVGEKRVPAPLEQPDKVDAYRKGLGLSTMAELEAHGTFFIDCSAQASVPRPQ